MVNVKRTNLLTGETSSVAGYCEIPLWLARKFMETHAESEAKESRIAFVNRNVMQGETVEYGIELISNDISVVRYFLVFDSGEALTPHDNVV
jgi:hypothetical protein